MARTLTRTSRNYTPGTYGPFDLDSFTQNDSQYLLLELTRESWPAADNLARVTVRWNTGEGAIFTVTGIGPDGTNPATVRYQTPIPRIASGRRAVSGANAVIEVFQTIRTALSFGAV